MTIAQQIFIKYVRTKMMFTLRLRSPEEQMKPVYISASEIGERFFPYPKYNRNKEMQDLHDAGEIKITQIGKAYHYEALKPGGYDLSLLTLKKAPQDGISHAMLANIQRVSLPVNAQSTPYFNLFIRYRDIRPELFFTIDEFCGRVHTPISNFHRTHRPNLLIDNENTVSLDVATMQPLLLGKLLFNKIGNNEFSTWINEGKDIYEELQNKSGLNSRDEAKKKFFEILFSKPTDALKELFGASGWINWINNYKRIDEPLNPHNERKPHSNLAWLLQNTEVRIMKQVWSELVNIDLPFLSVHDEIIVKETDYQTAKAIFESVLSKEFEYFKLNTKDTISEPGSVELNEQLKTREDEKQPFTEINQISPKINLKPFTKEFTTLWDITELEADYKALQVPEQPIKINQYDKITNVKNFIDSHFEIIKHNNGNPVFIPYYQRLIELKLVLKTENNGD
ncbi:MAG: hypothetical protein NVSMB24_04230 [Mucilaginibacter sp.]